VFEANVANVFGACKTDLETATCAYDVRDDGEEVTVLCDGAPIVAGSAAFGLDYLVWHINQRVAQASVSRLLVHAGAVGCRNGAVIIPAPSGGGKSTLVAALVRAGFGYLTDECVAIDAASGRVDGFTKAIGLKPGSWDTFSEVPPGLPARATYESPIRYATPQMLGGNVAKRDLAPVVLVVPELRGGGPALTPLARADALVTLIDQSFNFTEFGPRRMPVLADLVRRCACFRLDVTDLAEATNLLGTAFRDLGASR
jgi:hypothetical protein